MKTQHKKILKNSELIYHSSSKEKDPPRGEKILGIDYGQKYTGLAFSPDGIVVLPLKVIPTQQIFQEILAIIKEKNVKSLVVGLPLNKDGSLNPLCKEIKDVFNSFDLDLPVHYINERFSSQNIMIKNSKKNRIDDLSAVKILEFWLEGKLNF